VQGYQVIQAAEGISALTALEAELPDIAVIDFAMSGMTGAELARRVVERWPALPILFASGLADSDAITGAVGPNTTVLRKPFRVDELLHAIDVTLAQPIGLAVSGRLVEAQTLDEVSETRRDEA
jgi:DNA-binding response OmpR family regulator